MNADDSPTTIDAARKHVEQLSEQFVDNGHYIATVGDQWFVSTVAGVDRGFSWTQYRLLQMGERAAAGVARLRPGWTRRKRPGQRIKDMLRSEMKRAGLEVDPQEFDNFSTRIGTLIELVLSGAISIHDIGFEQDAETCPLERRPEGEEGT